MKALIICPDCGYQMLGVDRDTEQARTNAIAGMQRHQDDKHGVPMTPDRFITGLRTTTVQH
jgi:hypothetical protein